MLIMENHFNVGINNPFYGMHHTKESKDIISVTHKGKPKTQILYPVIKMLV